MVAIKSKERLGILDCLNHPWIKNEKFDEKSIPKIINKQRIKKQKNIGESNELDLNSIKSKNNINKENKLMINPNMRSTSTGSRNNNFFSPRETGFPPIPENKNTNTRFSTHSKGILKYNSYSIR